MKINTEQENELLEALEGIRTVLEAKRNGDDMRLTIDIQQDIEKVLQQVKLTYPTVKYPISLINGGCGSCFSNFISDMIPVYDRLTLQDEEFHRQLFALPDGTHLIEIGGAEEVIATNKITDEVYKVENSKEPENIEPKQEGTVEEPIIPSKRGRKKK